MVLIKIIGNWHKYIIILESYFYYSQITYGYARLKNLSDYPYIILNGPYNDVKTFGPPLLSFNSLLIFNNTWKGLIQVELRRKFFNNYILSIIFLILLI